MKNVKLYFLLIAILIIAQVTTRAQSVVDVIVNSPDHTVLETALIEANLVDDLEGSGSFTVFAPTDAAFAALPAGMLDSLLADSRGALTDILLYHLVKGKVMSSSLVNGQIVETYNDDDYTLTVTINAEGVFINNAKVTVADLEAENGVVHVIDAVLLPTTTSVSVFDQPSMEIYPNPASNYIRIKSDSPVDRLIIRDITGRIIEDRSSLNLTDEFSLAHLMQGIYLVTIKSGENTTTKKLVKE